MRLVTALVLVTSISGLPATALATPIPADDTVAEPGVPNDTTAPTSPDTRPDTTPDTGPDTIPTTDDPPAETVSTSPSATAGDGATSIEDQRGDVSIWWWIGGGFVAAAAVYGVAYSLRRRTGVEDWARSASLACDVGRAMSLTVVSRLDDGTPWVRPVRWSEQQERFDQLLSELSSSVPERDFPELLDAVIAADAGLVAAIDQVVDGTPAETARALLQPSLDDLATALTALEQHATTTMFGASLPSSRTTG